MMRTKRSSTRQWAALAAACGAVLAGVGLEARAAEKTWGGGGENNNFSTNANWIDGVAPAPNDALTFDGFARLTPTNDFSANTPFTGITFAPTAGPFNLTGNAITLSGDIVDQTVILTQTISLPLVLDGTRGVDVTGGGALTVAGVVSGPAGAGLTKTGNGLLTLGGA